MSNNLSTILNALETIAPLHLAESWDNVGLLLEAPGATEIRSIHLAIDLNETVLDEAIAAGSGMVVAYHPPIFAPLKRLCLGADQQGLLLNAIANGINIYSPHTALDAIEGGVTEWLADGLGVGTLRKLESTNNGPSEHGSPEPGRLLKLATPAPLTLLLTKIKQHLGLDTLRVAATSAHQNGAPITEVAICPGAGGSVLKSSGAELLLTGEMRHHDVLDALKAGTSVILCEHSSSERGYLPVLKRRLQAILPNDIAVVVSAQDVEPLSYL